MKDIGRYVKGYDICQRMKNKTEVTAGKLNLSEIPEKPQTYLTVDFITKLPLVAEKDAILVVCNRLSKMTHFVATIEETIVEGLVRLFKNNMWKFHGLSESIVLDKGPQFAVEMTKELNSMLEIEIKLSTLFHPKTDGQTERMNQELEQYLRFFVDYRQKNCPEWLASAEFVINNKAHLTTKISPFIVNYGRELRMGVDLRRREKMEKEMKSAERMRKVQKEAGVALTRVQRKMKR